MNELTLTDKNLLEIGYQPGKAIGLAIAIIETAYTDMPNQEQLLVPSRVLASHLTFEEDEHLLHLRKHCYHRNKMKLSPFYLRQRSISFMGQPE